MRDVFLFDDLPERPPRPAWAPTSLRDLTPEELSCVHVPATGGWTFGAPVVQVPNPKFETLNPER